ncbi:hypothetical protein [Parendozoicomonas haliclonae]|uniref:Uncharacterized protein n=1 Tax=Parendozoicomonas haliclonae TaxID=1960125 RepID=A0A1X7AJF8_9GAMM|nr:hypothetical protein [Parendozoicomonas haliclonae]SMA46573.1 hypothetical protein EHSB41UT_02204 [Parendozoicomonas haliclonae]
MRTIPLWKLCLPLVACLGFQQSAQADFDSLLRCTSKIVHSRVGGFDTLQSLATIVETALRSENPDAHTPESSSCWAIQKSLKGSSPASRVRYLHQISLLEASDTTKKLFSGFADPKSECSLFGTYAGADAWVLGLTGSVNLAGCHNTLGDVWLELRPGLEVTGGLGFGANCGITAGTLKNIEYSRSPVSLVPTTSMSMGLLLGVRRQSIDTPNDFDFNQTGIDFNYGARVNVGLGVQLRMSVLPLGKDFNVIKNRLFEHH